jgi:hypothetical protein
MLVKTLCKKHERGLKGVECTKGPFEDLSASLDPDQLKHWTQDAERADLERGEELDIYSVQMDKGRLFSLSFI